MRFRSKRPFRRYVGDRTRTDLLGCAMIPGEVICKDGSLTLNEGRETKDFGGRQHRRPAYPGWIHYRLSRNQYGAGIR